MVVLFRLLGSGAAAAESEHGAEVTQQLVGALLIGNISLCSRTANAAVLVLVVFDLIVLARSAGTLALVTPIDSLRNKWGW